MSWTVEDPKTGAQRGFHYKKDAKTWALDTMIRRGPDSYLKVRKGTPDKGAPLLRD
jgi:hypothetical protein